MYLATGLYEADRSRERAKTIYRKIVNMFPKNPLAIKTTDRRTRLSDVASIESSNYQTASRVEQTNKENAERNANQLLQNSRNNTQQCEAQKKSCFAQCGSYSYSGNNDYYYSCQSRCSSINCNLAQIVSMISSLSVAPDERVGDLPRVPT